MPGGQDNDKDPGGDTATLRRNPRNMGEKTMEALGAGAQLVVQGGALAASWTVIAAGLPDHTLLLIISGLGGGLSRWLVEKHRFWPEGLSTLIAGATIPVFLWPVGAPIAGLAFNGLQLEPASAVLLGGYVTGLLGLAIPALILDVFKARKKRILQDEGK